LDNLEREGARLTDLAQDYQDAYHSLHGRVQLGLSLIDDGGLLSLDEQRGLMRIAGRGRLGSAAMKPFGLLGRIGAKRSGTAG